MVKEDSITANRPDNTAFTQQRLPAWQPMLSAGIVIPGFVLIGVAFIGIGVALFVTSQNIQVLEVGYITYIHTHTAKNWSTWNQEESIFQKVSVTNTYTTTRHDELCMPNTLRVPSISHAPQRDYTGAESNSSCFACKDLKVKNCKCYVDFSLSKLFEVYNMGMAIMFYHLCKK